ncbi:hypothetical protein [Cellulomonas sp. Leaf334]|uniref:hypothetical protein n=1 Tax=Cellulomonas sp. Leaf334 TaxID=1736339 RepID=UPI000A48FFF0|nr:hypothetical protein [Cellulomonas sp. Leaf334]
MATASITAGVFCDPVAGQDYVYVAELPAIASADPGSIRDSLRRAVAEHGPGQPLLVRADAGTTLPGAWEPFMTFVRFRRLPADQVGPADEPPQPAVTIGPVDVQADIEARDAVLGWLELALRRGYDEEGIAADVARRWAHEIAADTDAESIVARVDGRPVGHLTYRTAEDDVTGERYIELVDVLVDGPDRSWRTWVERALVRSADATAGALGRSLVGNVVHAAGDEGAERARTVIRGLTGSGWDVLYTVWLSQEEWA